LPPDFKAKICIKFDFPLWSLQRSQTPCWISEAYTSKGREGKGSKGRVERRGAFATVSYPATVETDRRLCLKDREMRLMLQLNLSYPASC